MYPQTFSNGKLETNYPLSIPIKGLLPYNGGAKSFQIVKHFGV